MLAECWPRKRPATWPVLEQVQESHPIRGLLRLTNLSFQ